MKEVFVGVFDEERLLLSALLEMTKKKIEVNEVYTPYPVHAVFKILKRKTKLPIATFLFAILGLVMSYMFIYWTSVIDYPLIYGGKPIHSIPSFILIAFVSMISLSVFLSVISFLIRTRLYPGKKAIIHDPRITNYAFVMLIDKKPEMTTNELKTINSLLKENGAIEVIERQLKD